MDGRFVSYLRVSTEQQGVSGLGLEAQRAAVVAYLNGGSWSLLAEYVEIESGAKAERTELAKALRHCRLTGCKLIVSKLDRLTRNVAFLANLMESGVDFVACDNPHANRFTLHILAAVAEHEREMIATRTRAALTAAKARGKTLGGDRGYRPDATSSARARAAAVARADSFAREIGLTITEMRAGGATLRQIAATLAERDIKTAQGGKWTATAVRNVLSRL